MARRFVLTVILTIGLVAASLAAIAKPAPRTDRIGLRPNLPPPPNPIPVELNALR
jgi:hypothetical protein